MIKKKILTLVLTTSILTGTLVTVNTTKVSADFTDFAGIVQNIGETLILPELHRISLRDRANAGSDVENLFFIPPKFENGKFCISAYNFFNPQGTDVMYTVKAYPKNDANSPLVYNLKSGDMLELNTGIDTPEYILEFYAPGSSTPFGNYYLSKDFKNKNFGIALAQNNNIYYLQKETNRVINEELLEAFTNYDHTAPYYSASEANRIEFVETFKYSNQALYSKCYRQSRLVSKDGMSSPNFVDNTSINNLLSTWKEQSSNSYWDSVINSIRTSETYSYNNVDVASKTIAANNDVSYSNENIFDVDSDTIGIHPNGYLKYKIPVLKDGLYKINVDMEGEGNLIYSYNERNTGHAFDLNLTNSLTENSNLYVWLKSGVNYLTINNNQQADIKFKNMTVDYLSCGKDYNESNSVELNDLSKFNGYGQFVPEFINDHLRFYTNSSADFNVNAPSKGKYLIVTESSSVSGLARYQLDVSNLTNNTKASERILPLSDAFLQDDFVPISVGTRTINLEEGSNMVKFQNIDGILDMKSIKFIKVN